MGRTGCKGDRCAALEPHERAAQAARSIASVAQEPIQADPAEHTPSPLYQNLNQPRARNSSKFSKTHDLFYGMCPGESYSVEQNTLTSLINELATNPS